MTVYNRVHGREDSFLDANHIIWSKMVLKKWKSIQPEIVKSWRISAFRISEQIQ